MPGKGGTFWLAIAGSARNGKLVMLLVSYTISDNSDLAFSWG